MVADFLSRGKYLPSEWTLNHLIFQKVCQVIVLRPEIDHFASTLNLQLPKYCARCRDLQALEGVRTLPPVVRSSTVRLPILLDPPHSLGEDRSGRSGRGSGGSLLASDTMVPEIVISSGGTSQSSPSPEGPSLLTHVSSIASETIESRHLTLCPLSGRKESRRAFLLELQSS